MSPDHADEVHKREDQNVLESQVEQRLSSKYKSVRRSEIDKRMQIHAKPDFCRDNKEARVSETDRETEEGERKPPSHREVTTHHVLDSKALIQSFNASGHPQ